MFPKITGVSLYSFNPTTGSKPQFKGESQYIQASVAPQYSLVHPRRCDSEGISGVSPLANRLDIIS